MIEEEGGDLKVTNKPEKVDTVQLDFSSQESLKKARGKVYADQEERETSSYVAEQKKKPSEAETKAK